MPMKTRFLPSLVLLAVLLASCAPSAANETSSTQPTAPAAVVVQPTATLALEVPLPTANTAPTEAGAATALPIATSRGPNLEATDPLTVNLASGQIQFVEFFRFT